jgi:hypothetical protein
MTLALSKQKTALDAAANRLELMYCKWEGTWHEFEEEVNRHGSDDERRVLEIWPHEFKVSAIERSKRIINWQRSKFVEYLEKLDALTEAHKEVVLKDDDGSTHLESVPDNPTRIAALKYLISLIGDVWPDGKSDKPKRDKAKLPIDNEQEREILNALDVRSLTETRVERKVSFREGYDERHAFEYDSSR